MSAIPSYSKPLAIGHKFLDGLFDGEVAVQEKIDGSQISWSVVDRELSVRSRNADITHNHQGMFQQAVDSLRERQHLMVDGWTYRGEYLMKPKHNTLAYERVPDGYIILYDIDKGVCDYLKPTDLLWEATRIDLESVPIFYYGLGDKLTDEALDSFLENQSILGGAQVEGIVIKNYGLLDQRGKVVMGKLVRESFKENHNKDWKRRNPSSGSLVDQIIAEYGSEARWQKAVQHMAEDDKLVNAPQDIGGLMKEIKRDFWEEEATNLAQMVLKALHKDINRGITRGFPEWYKEQLRGGRTNENR